MQTWPGRWAEAAHSIGSRIEGSTFSGLLPRVEIGHIRMVSAGNDKSKSAVPAEGDLVEHPRAEFLGRARDHLATERAVEFDGFFVVRQDPHDQ
jgi:hypothetical protein